MHSRRLSKPANPAGGPTYNVTITINNSGPQPPVEAPRPAGPQPGVGVRGYAVIGLAVLGFIVLQLLGAGVLSIGFA